MAICINQCYDVIIIGAGPGGIAAAVHAAEHGLSVCIVEKDKVGGTCLHRGCIPTKVLIETAGLMKKLKSVQEFGITINDITLSWNAVVSRSQRIIQRLQQGVESLLKNKNITVVPGKAAFETATRVRVEQTQGNTIIDGKHIIIAAGSLPKQMQLCPFDGNAILSSDEALMLADLPQSIGVIGGGALGVELADMFSLFGVTVVLIEMMPHLLPQADSDISQALETIFKKRGIRLICGQCLSGVRQRETGCEVSFEGETPHSLTVSKVIVAAGRMPAIAGLGLERISIVPNKGFIPVNDRMETSCPRVYAIGDVINTPQYAHVAAAEGVHAVRAILGDAPPPIDYHAVPSVVFTNPPIASVGLPEHSVVSPPDHADSVVTKKPCMANAKNLIAGSTEGFIKTIRDSNTGILRGAHIIGYDAPELIHEYVIALAAHIPAGIFRSIIHAHPTHAESLWEAFQE